MRVRLTDIRDHLVQELDLPLDARDMPGWQSGVVGWSIGRKGTGAPIELDEPLVECHVGVFTVSYQVLLWGRAKKLPEVWLFPQGKSPGMLVPFEPGRWLRTDREELARVAMGGDVRLRMDQSPIRLGNYIIETIKSTEVVKEVCAFCNEPLRTYFRVGSPQACPPCAEKFKQEFRANVAKGYWKALGAGIVASVAGALIHGVLLLAAHVSLGSILIGVLVPTVMKVASKGTGSLKHRMTAVILTYIAGTLPTSFLLPDNAPPSTKVATALLSPMGHVETKIGALTFVVCLAIGMFVAWTIAAGNAEPQIDGPFQSKATDLSRPGKA